MFLQSRLYFLILQQFFRVLLSAGSAALDTSPLASSHPLLLLLSPPHAELSVHRHNRW